MEGEMFKMWGTPQKTENKRRMKVLCQMQEQRQQELNPESLTIIANNSFIRRMSEGKPIDRGELQTLMKPPPQLWHHIPLVQWMIVEVDENKLVKNWWVENFSCRKVSNDTQRRPSTLKAYHLILNLDNKEIEMQSLSNTDMHYFINFDTVAVQHKSTAQIGLEKELISLKVGDTTFDIYLTENTVPFPFSSRGNLQQKQHSAEKKKKHLEQLLLHSISHSRGQQFGLTNSLSLQQRYATEEQFFQLCQTGDILLFRDSHMMAKVQRVLTNSCYDHVGIIVRKDRHKVFIFDSSSHVGVSLVVWRQMMQYKWYENIQKVSWRKLEVLQGKGIQEKVQEFVRENLEKEFGLSLPKLLKLRSNAEQDKTQYFCSELVAKLYKFLGILPPDVSSTQYWPKHFSDAYNLELEGASLLPQRQLVFNETIMNLNYP